MGPHLPPMLLGRKATMAAEVEPTIAFLVACALYMTAPFEVDSPTLPPLLVTDVEDQTLA